METAQIPDETWFKILHPLNSPDETHSGLEMVKCVLKKFVSIDRSIFWDLIGGVDGDGNRTLNPDKIVAEDPVEFRAAFSEILGRQNIYDEHGDPMSDDEGALAAVEGEEEDLNPPISSLNTEEREAVERIRALNPLIFTDELLMEAFLTNGRNEHMAAAWLLDLQEHGEL